jgi:hypothetical protein
MSARPAIHFHIERLVLDGFAPGDRHKIGEAVRQELTRLFTDEGASPVLAKSAAIVRLDGGTFQMTSAPRPEANGAQIARAVFTGLKQ